MAIAREARSFRSFSHPFHRSFSRHARSSKPDETTKKKKPKHGAPNIAERCKSLLSLNWRGQLTTVKPPLVDKDEEKRSGRTSGEYTNYMMLDGKPVVWIPETSQHCPNLLLNNRASLIIGHTDPVPLMKAFQQVRKAPPHTVLLGSLIMPDDGEDMLSSGFIKAALKKQLSELQDAVNKSSSSIRAIMESGSHVLRTHVQCLNLMLESKGEDTFYQFNPSSCHYVDFSGTKHLVDLETSGKVKNPVSPLLPVIMEGINRNYGRRLGLKLLCACFLRIKVQDAFIFSADRKGINILAKVAADTEKVSKQGKKTRNNGSSTEWEWRDLRLAFAREVEDLNEFCVMLGQMEKQSLVVLNDAKAKMTPTTEEDLTEA